MSSNLYRFRTALRSAAIGMLLVVSVLPLRGQAAINSATTGLPVTTSGIHLGMEFNYLEPTVDGYKTQEGKVDYVSGADADMQNVPPSSGHAWHDKYLSWSRDAVGGQVGRPLAWYKRHHPDWILYQNDRKTIPVRWGDKVAPIDFTNPAVQQYVLKNWIFPALAGGFQGIFFDNNLGFNYLYAAGHFDRHGKWVQLYTGNWTDPRYGAAQVPAFQHVVAAVHARYPKATVAMNQGVDCNDDPIINQTGQQYADMIVDEEGFTNSANQSLPYVAEYGNQYCPSGKWTTVMAWARHLQRDLGKAMFFINKEPYNVTANMTAKSSRAHFDLQWALANYLLVKYAHTYFVWGGHDQVPGRPVVMQREYSAPIGSPTDGYYASQGVYMRDYTNGRAVVNPALNTSHTVRFPKGKYVDLYGHAVTTYSMSPHSGLVLLHAPGT